MIKTLAISYKKYQTIFKLAKRHPYNQSIHMPLQIKTTILQKKCEYIHKYRFLEKKTRKSITNRLNPLNMNFLNI